MKNDDNFKIVENHYYPIPSADSICKINIAGYSLDNFKTFDPTGYTILCRLGENFDGLNYFPKTSKIILDINQQSQIYSTMENFFPNVAKDLAISQEAAVQTAREYFSNKELLVQPNGIQGFFYNVMQSTQNSLPAYYTSKAVTIAKTTGLTGVQIITRAPLTFVGATYLGAVVFSYCGSVAGNNTVGLIFNSTSYVLSRPMRGVEVVLNGLILRPVSNIIGIPLILNSTQEILSGKGIPINEYGKIALSFERLVNSTKFKKIRKIFKIITKDKVD